MTKKGRWKRVKRVMLGEGYLRTSVRYSSNKEGNAVSLSVGEFDGNGYGGWIKLSTDNLYGKKIRLIAEVIE